MPDFFAFCEQLKILEGDYKKAIGVVFFFGGGVQNIALLKSSNEARAELAVARAEALLLRLFAADLVQSLSQEVIDTQVRQIKQQCTKRAKCPSVFAPILERVPPSHALEVTDLTEGRVCVPGMCWIQGVTSARSWCDIWVRSGL